MFIDAGVLPDSWQQQTAVPQSRSIGRLAEDSKLNTEDWKTRYLEEVRAFEHSEALLTKALARVSATAEGQTDELDDVLRNMQQHARKRDYESLQQDVDTLTPILNRLDAPGAAKQAARPDNGPSEPGAQDRCAELLDSLDLAPAQREASKDFRQRLADLESEQCFPELARHLSTLLRNAAQKPSGQEVLEALIDEVSVAQPDADALETLRDAAHTGGDWHRVLTRVVGELRTLVQRVSEDKLALEEIMRELTAELGNIGSVLSADSTDRHEGHQQAVALSERINHGVAGLQEEVNTAVDLTALRSSVGNAIETIRSGVTEFIEKDAARVEAAERRNDELKARLAAMESEAQELQDSLDESRDRLMRDSLTGAGSRFAYDEMIARALRERRRHRDDFCLVIFDIDHFKRINDTYGHAAGDRALKLVASTVASSVRETDDLFRIGGEEFALLMPRTAGDEASVVVEAIRQTVADTGFHFDEKPVTIRLSAGLTTARDQDTTQTLFERADDAMYRAKKAGRDRLVSR